MLTIGKKVVRRVTMGLKGVIAEFVNVMLPTVGGDIGKNLPHGWGIPRISLLVQPERPGEIYNPEWVVPQPNNF